MRKLKHSEWPREESVDSVASSRSGRMLWLLRCEPEGLSDASMSRFNHLASSSAVLTRSEQALYPSWCFAIHSWILSTMFCALTGRPPGKRDVSRLSLSHPTSKLQRLTKKKRAKVGKKLEKVMSSRFSTTHSQFSERDSVSGSKKPSEHILFVKLCVASCDRLNQISL